MMKERLMLTLAIAAVCCAPPEGYDVQKVNHRPDNGSQAIIEDPGGGTQLPDSLAASLSDTVIYVSAVKFPSGYDWRRDSSATDQGAKVVLYRNFSEILSLECSEKEFVSSDADMHHILDGDLYTEYSTVTQTIVGKNGKEVLRFDGREYLEGLLERPEGTYTLSAQRNSDTLLLRRSGEVVLKVNGRAALGWSSRSSGGTGALYEDGAEVCFCYISSKGGAYAVRNGKEASVALPTRCRNVRDVSVLDGKTYVVADNGNITSFKGNGFQSKLSERVWSEAQLFGMPGGMCVAGSFKDESDSLCSGVWWGRDSLEVTGPGDCLVYPSEEGSVGLKHSTKGEVELFRREEKIPSPEGCHYLFSRRCACVCGKRIYVLLTPVQEGAGCALWMDGNRVEMNLNGFLTGLEVDVSPPS